ncbi:MAG: hypothetical protein HOI95_06850 [Chromatiales bacterium]|jgi:hydrogenase expression/formation protein HypE|nr:hypothetical protein [Chromatiales bacterium]
MLHPRAVADACELLGLEPLYVACEGRFGAFVPQAQAAPALAAVRADGCGQAALIGETVGTDIGEVVLEAVTGGERVLDVPFGELLPRIC